MAKFPVLESIIIENIQPTIDGGRFPVKREPMDWVEVTADIFRHGHEKFDVWISFKKRGKKAWKKTAMHHVDNDQWGGKFQVEEIGYYEFKIEANTPDPTDIVVTKSETLEIRVDPLYARYGSWYEMFPRSQGTDPGKSATWQDCIDRLDDIKSMGFDTIYLVPIHPIGFTKRKGPNNALVAKPGDPGCPYAIGNEDGGHYALEPGLGGFDEFEKFVKACEERELILALDIALNCSPDHPHVKEHPEWFYHEEDGSIQCAINPPKRYEDVYPYNYFNENYKELWTDIKDMILFWGKKGFKIFRIDNPHTKAFHFWEWCINEIKKTNPELVFLAEAFTRPKIMYRLAKAGFDMSYSYFTWRENKYEMQEYLEELTQGPAKEFMRANFFPTTPDIFPKHLHYAPPSAFKARLFLAGTLSSLMGMYNGYELCENVPSKVKEELDHSEKYEFKVHDWNAPNNIKNFVSKLNFARNYNTALQEYDNLVFHHCPNDQLMVYSKRDEANGNTILCVANMDFYHRQSGMVRLNLHTLGLDNNASYELEDILTQQRFIWNGSENYVEIDPAYQPGHIFVVHPK